MREIIGFEGGDSILAPGGSISNMYAVLCARHKYFPEYKTKGMSALKAPVAIYTSAQVTLITRLKITSVLTRVHVSLCSQGSKSQCLVNCGESLN
jgi:glutamate/tyrosine decarboxylase-like PLP-dependent enzyme